MSSRKLTPANAVHDDLGSAFREREPAPTASDDASRTDKRLRWRQLLARLRDRQTADHAGRGSPERRRSRAM